MEPFSCQPLFDRLTRVAIKTGVLKDFAKLTTTLEKIKFCWNTVIIYDKDIVVNFRNEIQQILGVLYRQCPDHTKSEALATQAKEKGTKAFLKKKDAEAHLLFTKCLKLAPEHSTILPIAYGNRSAVLFQMGKYKEALEDIARAEKSGYSSSTIHKLLVRRCSCYIMLGEMVKAEAAHEKCKELLLVIPDDAKDKYEKNLKDLEIKLQSLLPRYGTKSDEEDLKAPHLFQGESPTVTYMSCALEIRMNEMCGRHVVASKPVGKGSVVFVERPYAAILLPEHHHTHCHNCFSFAANPLPCQTCQDAVFCSEECRDEGFKWHQYECGILHILSAVGIAHLALRVILVTGWKLYCQISNEDIKEKIPGFNSSSNVYNGRNVIDGYRAVFHLMPHLDNSLPEDQLQYCMAAVLLTCAVLDKTSFSQQSSLEASDSSSPVKDLDTFNLANAIMRHIAQLVANAHAITQVMTGDCGVTTTLEEVAQKRIASAIYPTVSLLNHSCRPTIINSFFNNLLVIRMIQEVKPSDQIYNCYGPHYCRQAFKERQESLRQQYFFTCKCGPCTEPHYKIKEAAWSGFHCESCGGVSSWTGGEDVTNKGAGNAQGLVSCLDCYKTNRPSQWFIETCTKVSALHETAEEALQNDDLATAVVNLKEAVKLGSKAYLLENQYFITLRDTLAKTLSDAGDFENSCQELSVCMQATESRYGCESVELAHELLKFSDVLTLAATNNNKKLVSELGKVNAKIDKIFTLSYGPHWKKYLKIDN